MMQSSLQEPDDQDTLIGTDNHLSNEPGGMKLQALINGFRMNYEVHGDGPVMLFVHGFPLDHTMWHHQVKAFASSYRVIVPDLRGHGQSEAVPGPYQMDQLADDLKALLAKIDTGPVILAGLSMGGYIAFAFWRAYPHLVQAMALIDTRAGSDTVEGRNNRYAMSAQVKAEGTAAMVEGMLPKLLSPVTLEHRPKVVSHTLRMMADTSAIGVIGALEGMAARPDSTPTLATISVPTLIVVGEHDSITPPTEAQTMQTEIQASGQAPSVTLTEIPDAGHLAPLENPDAFNQAFRNFLAKLAD
jgi:pimeloyl-ACP methyl ester carboxylesterase